MKSQIFKFKSRVWMWPGPSSWHFVTLPKKEVEDIKKFQSPVRRGFGAIKVEVTIGSTSWLTSIFPDKETQSYILPLKQEVRKKERIGADQLIKYTLAYTCLPTIRSNVKKLEKSTKQLVQH